MDLSWVWISYKDELGQGGLRIYKQRSQGADDEVYQGFFDSPVTKLLPVQKGEVLVVTLSEIRKLSIDPTGFVTLSDWKLSTEGVSYLRAWTDPKLGLVVLGGLQGKALVLNS